MCTHEKNSIVVTHSCGNEVDEFIRNANPWCHQCGLVGITELSYSYPRDLEVNSVGSSIQNLAVASNNTNQRHTTNARDRIQTRQNLTGATNIANNSEMSSTNIQEAPQVNPNDQVIDIKTLSYLRKWGFKGDPSSVADPRMFSAFPTKEIVVKRNFKV